MTRLRKGTLLVAVFAACASGALYWHSDCSPAKLSEEEQFYVALNAFVAATTPEETQTTARALIAFSPLDGKGPHNGLWRQDSFQPRITSSQVEVLIRLSRDPDWLVQHAAIDTLAASGDAGIAALPRLIELGKIEDTKFSCKWVMESLVRQSPPVRAKVIEMTRGPDIAARAIAADALSQWNWQDAEVKSHLISLLKDGDDVTAQTAADALRGGPDSWWPELLPILFAQLDSQRESRSGFLSVVPEMNEVLNPYLPRIFDALTDRSPEVRLAACEVIERLAKYGTQTHDVRGARAKLTDLLSDPNAKVQLAAKEALVGIKQHQ